MVFPADRPVSAQQQGKSDLVVRTGRSFSLRPSQIVWPGLWLCFTLLLLIPTLCFLLVAFSPALFDQGGSWLTVQSFVDALSGPTLRGLLDSFVVSVAAAAGALLVSVGLAWLVHRTNQRGRQIVTALTWTLLLVPSYLEALGWESLLERNGVLSQIGIDATPLRLVFMGPVGIAWILMTRGVPFSYLAVSAGLVGVGREYEDATRVHGGNRRDAFRIVFAILLPALWSAIAIVFAESMSDFGVASTLAAGAHFPVATYSLYLAIDSMPIQFPVASAVGWFLVVAAAVALFVQYRTLRGRSFAVLSGRTRPMPRQTLSLAGQLVGASFIVAFFSFAVGVPTVGAVSASLLKNFGASFTWSNVTLDNFQAALSSADMASPLLLSARLAAITATFTVLLGTLVGRVLSRRQVSAAGRLFDLLLLGSVALPSIVLGAGYIFAYNLPLLGSIGLNLYGTTLLLGMAYLAAALPTTTRLLVGPLAQIQSSLVDAARVHGAGELRAQIATVLPLLAPSLLWAWLMTFSGTLLELPISEILYPPGQEPLAVAITKLLENYDFAGGSAMTIIAIVGMLVVIGAVLGITRLVIPNGWRQRHDR